MNKIGFIGLGNMGTALIEGLIEKKTFSPPDIWGSDVNKERCAYISDTYHINIAENNEELVENCEIVILSIKPQNFEEVLKSIRNKINPHKLIISIAAGIKIKYIREILNTERIIRVMPNTPALVKEGITAICTDFLKEEDKSILEKIFLSVGEIVWIKEKDIDAITGLSGSGPAYVFAFIEGLIDGGIRMGLPRDIAQKLAIQTVFGSAKLLKETKKHPTILKEMVTSPGGTTIRALEELEKNAFHYTVMSAVIKATEMSKKLGSE